MDWLESKIVEAIAKYNTRIVFIDHLDFVVSFKAENHHLNIAQAMRDLKGLAKKWNIVIFLVAHLTKAKMDTQPTIEDLRGSASIGQEADTVILLWRETKREDGQVVITDNVNVSVQANRRTGRTGNVKMCFADGKFTEKDWESDVSAAQKAFRDF
jgi:replicative DNA helicase